MFNFSTYELRDYCSFENPFGNITFLHLRLKLKPGEHYSPTGPFVSVSVGLYLEHLFFYKIVYIYDIFYFHNMYMICTGN